MEIACAACHAAIHVESVIPEIAYENRVLHSPFLDLFMKLRPLGWRSHILKVGFFPCRNVLEEPSQLAAFSEHLFYKHVACQVVCAGSGTGSAESVKNPFPVEPVEAFHDLVVSALAPAGIRLLTGPFDGKHGSHVPHCGEAVRHLLVKQRAVGVNLEETVIMFLPEIKQVGPHKTLTAREGEKVHAQFLGFVYHPVQHIKGEVVFLRIGRGVASLAMQVAAHGGAYDYEIGKVYA